MSETRIIKLNQNPSGFGDTKDELDVSMFESDIPIQHTHSYYEDDKIGLYVGVWDTTSMIEHAAPYECDEFMILLEGDACLKNNKTNRVKTVKAGETFIIPKGLDCQWQQNGYLRKFYVISEHPDEDIPSTPNAKDIIVINEEIQNSLQLAPTSDGHSKKILYQNNSKRFTTGIWCCDALSTEEITFPYNEFLYITHGDLTCIEKNGDEHKFSQGDAVFIPQGTLCSWQVKKKLNLYFVQIK